MRFLRNGGYLDISGRPTRIMMGLQSLFLGFIYLFFQQKTASYTYLYQSQLLPFWVYAVLFLAVGITTLISADIRLTRIGRRIAVTGMSVFLLYSLTFVPYASLSALAVYPLITYAFFREAFASR